MSDPLRIAVLGLDERALNLFRMFFRGPCQNLATIIDQEKEADAFLIDLDTQQGQNCWRNNVKTILSGYSSSSR